MASQFVQLPFPPSANSSNYARLPFAGNGSSNFVKFPVASGPTLLSVGPFSNLSAPLVSSLPNITYSTNRQQVASTRTNPIKANVLTLNDANLEPSFGCMFIWCDTLNIQSQFFNCNGNDGQPGAGSGPATVGGAGGTGGSGGGGGSVSDNPTSALPGGPGSKTGGNGFIGNTNQSFYTGGPGGFGYALPGTGAGGSGWLSDGTPFAYLQGGNSDIGTPTGLGFGAGGSGGNCEGFCCGCCSSAPNASGGGGGGGGLLVIVCRILNFPGISVGGLLASGGNGAGGNCCGAGNGLGGGGGSIQLFTQKISTPGSNFLVQTNPGLDGSGFTGLATGGNALCYQIAHNGTSIVNSTANFQTANWDNT